MGPSHRNPPSAPHHHLGMTLLEVVLAIAIFFGAVAALSQLMWSGTRAAVQARLKSQAILRCETKLNELVSGVEPLQAGSGQLFPDDPAWAWAANIQPSTFPELLQVEVVVQHTGSNGLGNVEFRLKRWMRDPVALTEIATTAAEEAASASATASESESGAAP